MPVKCLKIALKRGDFARFSAPPPDWYGCPKYPYHAPSLNLNMLKPTRNRLVHMYKSSPKYFC